MIVWKLGDEVIMAELLDIYDENKIKTNKTIERKQESLLEDNEYFLYVQCWIINLEGKILLTQRKLNKLHGGMWEPTGGCVCSGETSKQGILREISEEIGLHIKSNELQLIKTIKEKRKSKNCFRDIYIIQKDIKLNHIKFLDGEVIDAKYVTIEEFKDMIKNRKINPWLRFFEKEYYKFMKGK